MTDGALVSQRQKNRLVIAAIVLAFASFVALHGVHTWDSAITNPAEGMSSDQLSIGNMYLKSLDPSLFMRDFIYKDNRYFAFYTPSFLIMARAVASLTGDYVLALAALQMPLLAIYLACAYLLFWQVSKSHPVSIFFTLLSVYGMTVAIDFWRVVGLNTMLPRTLSLPPAVLAAAVFVTAIRANTIRWRSGWLWLAAGLLTGVAADFHPTTGMALALALGFALLLVGVRQRWGFVALAARGALLVAGTLLAASPVVVAVVSQSSIGKTTPADFDFAAFASAFMARVAMLPYASGRISILPGDWQSWAGLLWLLLTLAVRLPRQTNRRSITSLIFMSIQLAFAFLLADGLAVGPLLLLAGYLAWRWWQRDEEQETVWLELIAGIVFAAWLLPVVLKWAWLRFEIVSLTTVVAELPRGARLLTIPLCALGARFALRLVDGWRTQTTESIWAQVLLIGSLALMDTSGVFLYAALLFAVRERLPEWKRDQPALYAIWLAASALFGAQMILTELLRGLTLAPIGISLGIGLAAWAAIRFRMNRGIVVPGTAGLIILSIGVYMRAVGLPLDFSLVPWDKLQTGHQVVVVIGVLAVALCALVMQEGFSATQLALSLSAVTIVFGLVQTESLFAFRQAVPVDPASAPPVVRAAAWTRDHTDTQSLFFPSSGATVFRLFSHRSVTHGRKELNIIGYSTPADLVAATQRDQRLSENGPEAMLTALRETGADYAVLFKDDAPLPLMAIYSEPDFTIYRNATPPPVSDALFEFDKGIVLLGGSISRSEARPCEMISVDTWWEAKQPLDFNYSLSLHLLASDGSLAAQNDGVPANLLMGQWRVGQPYLDSRALSLPCHTQPGHYRITITLYNYENMERLWVQPAGGGAISEEIPLGTITVEGQ